VNIRNAKMEDLAELVAIEHQCFPKAKAATKEAFEKRIRLIPDSFFVAEIDGRLVGLVNGPVIASEFITDDLFAEIKENPPACGHQTILGLAVHPDFQKRGVASALLHRLEKAAGAAGRESVTLTCQADLISFYEKRGYINRGVSDSVHGGAVWYNMSKKL
jgi:ribosomal protein S18 acetylase RimI-like enzyme